MKPVFVSHEKYQNFVMEQLQAHYSGSGILVLRNDMWPTVTKLWITDLSVTKQLSDSYGKTGPPPRDPACMLRCYLLLILTNPTMSITQWVNELYKVPLYAILSGFEPNDVPGVGTFYDFFERLWGSDQKNAANKCKSKKQRKRKPKKGKKGEKAPTATPGRVKRLVEWIIPRLNQKKELPSDRLFEFFQSQILTVSANLGLLGDVNKLNVAGDGTPVVTASHIRSKPTCNCRAQGIANCGHVRKFSQPDCDSGWDSHREKYFNGYHLYMINACDSPYDLPLYPRLHPASSHDSVSFVVSWSEFSQRFDLGAIEKMLLDAAHDAYSIYELLDHNEVDPIIDLNKRGKNDYKKDGDIRVSPQGIPICPIGKEMKPNGYDNTQHRQKWRCPLACGTKNSCETPCSTAKYGRTYHTYTKENKRLFPKLSRETKKWKTIYKRRTSVERSNKREKIDYHLEAGRHRSTMMWYIRLYGIMMCQHIDAWYKHRKDELDFLKGHIFHTAS